MLSAKIAYSRLLGQRAARAVPAARRAWACAGKPRFSSSNPELFTLDLELEAAAPPAGPHDAGSAAAGVSAEPGAEKTADFGARAPQQSPPEGPDQAQLHDILADFVFDDPAGHKQEAQDAQDVDAFFGDLFAPDTGAHAPDRLLLDSDAPVLGRHAPGATGDAPPGRPDGRVVADEKDLFEKIFATYAQSEASSTAADIVQRRVLANLQDSVRAPAAAADHVPVAPATERLSGREQGVAERKTVEALAPTLEYIDQMTTREAVVGFTRRVLEGCVAGAAQRRDFHLHKAKGETSKAFLTRHARLSRQVRAQSEASPGAPVLNAFTVPVLFNHVLRAVVARLHDGALALSLFNRVKTDLRLYSVVCNQATYNEMLKVHWVFFGKRSLCEIELLVVEMQNNGFAGDGQTFVVLLKILAAYHAMKAGRSSFSPGGLPVWAHEDDKRVRNLAAKLQVLGKLLERERLLASADRSARRSRHALGPA